MDPDFCGLKLIQFGGSFFKETACNVGDPGLIPGSGRSPREGISYPLQYSGASLVAQLVKNLPAMQKNLGSIPGLGRSPGEGNSYPLQYSGLENSMDCIVHGITKSQTLLSNFHFHSLRKRILFASFLNLETKSGLDMSSTLRMM